MWNARYNFIVRFLTVTRVKIYHTDSLATPFCSQRNTHILLHLLTLLGVIQGRGDMPADIEDIELRYAKLKTRYINGDLNYNNYIAAVDALRVQDENGTYWQIRADDGKWVRWDGSTWVTSERSGPRLQGNAGYVAQARYAVQSPGLAATGPAPGITSFLKSFVKSAILGFMKNIPWMILIAIVVWFLHLFLLGIANPSAAPGTISGLASILVIPGNEVVGAIFWLLLSWIISTLIFQIRTKRFGKSLQKLGRIPEWLHESFQRSQALSFLLLSLGFVIALLIAALIQNVIISIQLILVSLGWLAAQKEGIMVVFVGTIWGSVSRVFASGKKSSFNPSFAGSVILGLSVGFFLSLLVPLKEMTWILAIFFVFIVMVTVVVARERAYG